VSADDKHMTNAAVDAVLIYATFPDQAGAEAVAEDLVATGLVACANIVPGLTSIFIWEGKLEREREVAMIMKTRQGLAARAVEETRRRHPYDNPAIVVVPLVGGAAGFLAWIGAQTAGSAPGGD
jgi:periplasmic divalent cation tolerance protein